MRQKQLLSIITIIIFSLNLVSCYRMPREDEYSVVPSINNPDVTREKPNNNFTPSMGF